MSTISHTNLRELCRACLRTLKHNNLNSSDDTNVADGTCEAVTGSTLKSLLLPNLCKLFMSLTTYDVNHEYDDFPKLLCEWCYGRLLDYDEFRKLAVRSTEMLYQQWNANNNGESSTEEEGIETKSSLQQLEHFKQEDNLDENDDNKLVSFITLSFFFCKKISIY